MATRVVIAEDEAIIRLDLKETLEEEGYEVVGETGRGDEAVELVREHGPDLVILDIHMPDGDGIATLEQLRRDYSPTQLPVIMATAKDDDEEVVHAFELGANDFVSKPINFPVLFARLRTHLQLKRTIEELERLR